MGGTAISDRVQAEKRTLRVRGLISEITPPIVHIILLLLLSKVGFGVT